MTENLESEENFTSWEDVAYSNTVQNEALLRLLIRKGIVSKEEFVEESKTVHRLMQDQKPE